MRPRKLILALLLFSVLSARPVAAQDKSLTISPSKEAKIHELLKQTGAAKLGLQMVDQMMASFKQTMPSVPAAFWENFREEIKADDLEAMMVPIYASHFDEKELQGMLDFYNSPVGTKLLQEMPDIATESMSAGKKWGEALAQKVIERLKKGGYKASTHDGG